MNIFPWIETHFHPEPCDSEHFFYNEMESQSGRCLPLIYQPFDLHDRSHWADRGSMFDYRWATQAEGRHLLDFGPGDGWPSLIVAPFAASVTGVDGSEKRVAVCTENARRMGIGNARFVHVPPGEPLPFETGSFDGVMAASSIEQSPDPRATLFELYRVLKPGGRLRMEYETLNAYRDGQLRQVDVDGIDDSSCWLTLYDRRPAQETAHMLRLRVDLPGDEMHQALAGPDGRPTWKRLNNAFLHRISSHVSETRRCDLTHPSGRTFIRWLREAGFAEVRPTHAGDHFAARLFDATPFDQRPASLEELDDRLGPRVKIVVDMPAPVTSRTGYDAMLTAVK